MSRIWARRKSDVGTGYELDAITAVVLGGTSVFGGRGTIWGTLFGLFALSVLQNGLHLAALPSELTGVLTGVLLIVTIGIDRWRSRVRPGAKLIEESDPVKNSQVAILCASVIAGSLIVAGTNVWLVRSLGRGSIAPPAGAHRPVIAMMPKAKGDPYFVSVRGRRRRSGPRAGRRPHLGWPHRPRSGQAERAGRELDHPPGGRDRRRRRKQSRHLHGSAQSPRARHSRSDLGCRRRARRPRLLRQPGDPRRNRQHADRRSRPAAGRQGRFRHHHRAP